MSKNHQIDGAGSLIVSIGYGVEAVPKNYTFTQQLPGGNTPRPGLPEI